MMGETGQTIFAVSDVHGHYTELMAALEQAGRFGLGLEMGTPVGVAAILRRGGDLGRAHHRMRPPPLLHGVLF